MAERSPSMTSDRNSPIVPKRRAPSGWRSRTPGPYRMKKSSPACRMRRCSVLAHAGSGGRSPCGRCSPAPGGSVMPGQQLGDTIAEVRPVPTYPGSLGGAPSTPSYTASSRGAMRGHATRTPFAGPPPPLPRPAQAHARAERPRPPLVVAAPRAVPRHGEHRVWVTGQDAGECGERRAETVTRLDAAQEEQPRALGEGVRGGPPVGPEELQVHS